MAKSIFSKSVIARSLESSRAPAYLVDRKRRIVFANHRLIRWSGVSAACLAEAACEYHSLASDDDERARNGLCPPPQAFDGQLCRGTIHALTGASWDAWFLPILEEPEGVHAVLVLCGDMGSPWLLPSGPSHAGDPNADVEPWTLHAELAKALQDPPRRDVPTLLGTSPRAQQLRRQVEAAGETTGRVLVRGPRGTDREGVARSIHARRDARGPASLIPLACPLLDAELLRTTVTALIQELAVLESEQAPELLLLDVDQLSPAAQEELEGFLAIDELGLRTLATSAESLLALEDQGTFRGSLAFALTTMEIVVPSLAERPEDIPLLVQYCVEAANVGRQASWEGLSDEALEQLVAHPWPGNEEQLRECMSQIATSAGTRLVAAEELPKEVRWALDGVVHPPRVPECIDLQQTLVAFERQLIQEHWEQAKFNKAETARRLGISRQKLLRRMEQLGLGDD